VSLDTGWAELCWIISRPTAALHVPFDRSAGGAAAHDLRGLA
jgi:hypothetical protein